MRKRLFIVIGLLSSCAALFGVVKAVPVVRYALAMYRHTSQAATREPSALADWRKEFGDPDSLLAKFPKQSDDESARCLIELARRLGIEIARPQRPQGIRRETAVERDLSRAIADYDLAELTRTGGPAQGPSETVHSFLQAHRREINDIVSFLSTSESLVWEMDVSRGPEAPIPNLLGEVRLQRLLVAEALDHAHRGEEAKAIRVFRASWNLNASLRDRPEVISQLVAISVARMHIGLARILPLDPIEWRGCLGEHDYRTGLVKAMEVESVGVFHHLPKGSSRFERASRADFLDLRRSCLVALRDLPISDESVSVPCKGCGSNRRALSMGQIVANIAWPNLENAMRKADRLIVDAELTDRILEARIWKARLGHWPKEIPGVEMSRMPGGRWRYAVAGGRMRISFSRELRWSDQKGIVLPLRFESD